ncbi:hypothetical protein [Chengkuizengella axinellae]|uniref:IDEAL domain-containing protein n=1 Tax=Chengkuizengella axinellae TaxID=3064388 RepID=A0ABT9IVD4_9BACL|nr:hypothetical protein [Chengkuizengella sp. 2205SS18-9]MDP5273306.1 hypothetical protein [Chengkuizengella sp. 2205SS18-9]
MKQSYEVEYCNLELRFDRQLIQNFITNLIEEGYSLYWNENDKYFIISIRLGKKLLKLKFERMKERFKMIGNYSITDRRLAELMEKMIENSRGHAIVKRFLDSQILIENIMFGEIIRTVEINGVEQKVLYQKDPYITLEAVIQAFESSRIEERIPILRYELDYELTTLQELLKTDKQDEIEMCKQRLKKLSHEFILLEG